MLLACRALGALGGLPQDSAPLAPGAPGLAFETGDLPLDTGTGTPPMSSPSRYGRPPQNSAPQAPTARRHTSPGQSTSASSRAGLGPHPITTTRAEGPAHPPVCEQVSVANPPDAQKPQVYQAWGFCYRYSRNPDTACEAVITVPYRPKLQNFDRAPCGGQRAVMAGKATRPFHRRCPVPTGNTLQTLARETSS